MMTDLKHAQLRKAFTELLDQHLKINVLPEKQDVTRKEWMTEAGLQEELNLQSHDTNS